MKFLIIALAFLGFTQATSASASLPEFSVRGSASMFWNSGWKDKFFFHTFRLDELTSGPVDLGRTLRHTNYINAEVWWSPAKPSEDLTLSFTVKYRLLTFSLSDYISPSWVHWRKNLDADLHFASLGIRIQHPLWLFRVYGGIDIGYCFGMLTTMQYYESPNTFIYSVQVKGNGGGVFHEFVLGASTQPVWRFGSFDLGFFFECGLRISPEWDPIDVDEVVVNEEVGDIKERIKNWLIHKDRQISELDGYLMSAGVEIGIN